MENPLLAITWSPKGDTITPKWSLHYYLYYYFASWHRGLKSFTLYPELNHAGNIHFHGTIQIGDKVKWYKSLLPALKRKGFVKIKIIDNLDKWTNYIQKDWLANMLIFDINKPITRETVPSKTNIKRSLKEASLEVSPLKRTIESYFWE